MEVASTDVKDCLVVNTEDPVTDIYEMIESQAGVVRLRDGVGDFV